MRYEEDEVFPDDLFYSFYYYSWQAVESLPGCIGASPGRVCPSPLPRCWNCCKGGYADV